MPPLLFFNFGIPAAKRPPSCGAASGIADVDAPVSLLLLFLFAGGTGGANPVGGLRPGIGGAPIMGPSPPTFAATIGADRSFV